MIHLVVLFLPFVHVRLSIILVNRLVLNLRRAGNINNSTVPSLAMPSFAEREQSFLGNIGAPLRDGSENYDRDDDDVDRLEAIESDDVQPGKE